MLFVFYLSIFDLCQLHQSINKDVQHTIRNTQEQAIALELQHEYVPSCIEYVRAYA